MSNLLVADVTIRGVRPFWFHKAGPDAIPLEKQERTGVAGNNPEEWRKTVSVTNDGRLYMDPSYIFGCLRNGAKNTKSGRATMMGPVASTLEVLDDVIFFDRAWPGFPNGHALDIKTVEPPDTDPTLPVYMDVRGVKNKNSGGSLNIRYRVAMSRGWQCSFRIRFDKTVVDRAIMEAVVHDAGQLVGVGDGRAIGQGRFEVVGFQVSQDA